MCNIQDDSSIFILLSRISSLTFRKGKPQMYLRMGLIRLEGYILFIGVYFCESNNSGLYSPSVLSNFKTKQRRFRQISGPPYVSHCVLQRRIYIFTPVRNSVRVAVTCNDSYLARMIYTYRDVRKDRRCNCAPRAMRLLN